MLYFCKDKKDCTGCTACQQVCPKKCITMVADEEGFLYPEASDKCVHCGLCEKICPIQSKHFPSGGFEKEAYAAKSKDYQIWHRSASGGAFSEICKAWDKKTIHCCFVGAAWDGLTVRHEMVSSLNDLGRLCKSKYVSSRLEDSFSAVKMQLSQGNGVVFCGTPCQVSGLKAYLGNYAENENLLTIDLICHGAGSIQVFQTAMDCIGSQIGSRVCRYEFRSKRKNHELDHLCKVSFEDGSVKYLIKDPYMQLFLTQKALRSCCGKNCIFRNENRVGDITIADFKGLAKVFPDLAGARYNYSTVVFNTAKGASIKAALNSTMELRNCGIDDIKKYNPLFYRQTIFSETRDDFFRDFVSNPYEAVKAWTKDAQVYKPGIFRTIYEILPVRMRKCIYTVRRKL